MGLLLMNTTGVDLGGGGLAICAKTDLSPVLVRDGGAKVEAITIDIHIKIW